MVKRLEDFPLSCIFTQHVADKDEELKRAYFQIIIQLGTLLTP